MIHITLPDNSVKDFEKGITPYDIALSISEGLARNVLAAKVNDKVVALNSNYIYYSLCLNQITARQSSQMRLAISAEQCSLLI